jgi:hypothetical protein
MNAIPTKAIWDLPRTKTNTFYCSVSGKGGNIVYNPDNSWNVSSSAFIVTKASLAFGYISNVPTAASLSVTSASKQDITLIMYLLNLGKLSQVNKLYFWQENNYISDNQMCIGLGRPLIGPYHLRKLKGIVL